MVLRIAHRGASKYAPENSIEAFRKALELGTDVVEFDVRLTKDDKIVLMHDRSVKRTTNGRGLTRSLSLEEIKRLCLKNSEKVPTLQEALDTLKNKCICKIDIKDRMMEKRILEAIERNGIENSVMITSEIDSVLKKIKRLSPKIKIEAGGFKKRIPIEEIVKRAKVVKADIIGPHFSITTKKLVEEAHKNELEVHVWPVNDKETIEKMKSIGVDGITSGCPDII